MDREEFEILGEIADAEVIAVGRRIREHARLTKRYGRGRWRKMKGGVPVAVAAEAQRLWAASR